MKRILILRASAAAILLVAGISCREDAVSGESAVAARPAGKIEGTTYAMEIKGMVCGGCMMEVKDALARLDGVPDEAVAFKRGSRPETKRVVFTAKSPTLTKEQVNEALGEAKERLIIEDFAVEPRS